MQSIISNDEREELLYLAKITAKDYKIISCCIYGSKVAGYARPDSDYDLLLILKDYDRLIEYIYHHGNDGLDASILAVDSEMLIKDAQKAALGEFVVGRLLHPYEPLLNGEYLKEVEVIYKRNVILEAIRELASITPLYKEMIIPIKYFLLTKIKKRAKIYPHALYSYVKTYTNEHSTRNLEFTLDGFRRALHMLEVEGYIKFYDKDSVIIIKDISTKRDNIANIINGTFAYLVHFYAGRNTLNFFKEEARSKLKRRKEIASISQEFINTENMLRLKDGLLLQEKNWFNELFKHMNIKDYTLTITNLGDLHATTRLYTIKHDDETLKYVIKHYASLKLLKWVGLNAWLLGLVKFDEEPSTRQVNEYRGLIRLKELGFNVAEVIGLSYKQKITITKYIQGITLDSIIKDILANKSRDASKIKEFGKLLYNIHKHGYVIRDTKASNVIISNDKLYLVDLEQFKASYDPTWDIICFIYYSLKFTDNEEGARIIVRAFLDGYTDDKRIDCRANIEKAMSKKYILPFYPAMVISTVKVIRDEMRSYT